MIPKFNVGWLSRFRPFAEGAVDSEVMDILAFQVKMPRGRTRGKYPCYFCSAFRAKGVAVSVEIGGVEHPLGGGEIHAFSKDGDVFAAPDLIYHYIRSHGYRPPNDFMLALAEGWEGRVNGSTIRILRELVENAPRIEDRVDAAIDLIQVASASSADWLSEIVKLPTCHPYVRKQVESALRLL
ncbi:hypothetical protein [Streptomyces sp. RTGN2]|uniref:DUF7919 family protein n=1 Tax=Streptomyces sp. RTGN2 TaxID=3016525 RepID=UPI002557C267|nr:hypothetical protein [Streptomyces sp. RTGN2]